MCWVGVEANNLLMNYKDCEEKLSDILGEELKNKVLNSKKGLKNLVEDDNMSLTDKSLCLWLVSLYSRNKDVRIEAIKHITEMRVDYGK